MVRNRIWNRESGKSKYDRNCTNLMSRPCESATVQTRPDMGSQVDSSRR